MDINFLFSSKNNKNDDIPVERGNLSDIINMSQNISGDWLKKIAEKKAVIQEQIQEQKDKPKVPKVKSTNERTTK